MFDATGEQQRVGWVLAGTRLSHWSQPPAEVDLATRLAWATCSQKPSRRRGAGNLRPTHRGSCRAARPRSSPTIGASAWSDSCVRTWPHRADCLRASWSWAVSSTSAHSAPPTPSRPVTALPRQPAVVRDLSILIDAGLPAASVRGTIRANAPATLEQVREFDRYEGKGVPEGQVGLSIRLTFRDRDRTLTDAEVQQAVETIVTALAADHGATLRGHQRGERHDGHNDRPATD